MECHEEWMSIRESYWECRSYCLSPSLSLPLPRPSHSLFLHRCISTLLCVLHSIDATDTLNFVSIPVYDVQDFYFHLSSRIVT